MLQGSRKGEWWELPIPGPGFNLQDKEAYEAVERSFPIPRKIWGRLYSIGGIRQQVGKLLLHLFPPQSVRFEPEYAEVEVLFEDDFCMVVNKPAGMPVHPAESGQGGTLANAVAYYYESTGQACAVKHIHRLDSETTGAVLYAKNELAQYILDAAMRDKRIERQYIALAEGIFQNSHGTIHAPIGRDRHHSGKRRVTGGGDDAITHYRVRRQFEHSALIDVSLETGRTHQIRVHLSHIGHPLVGDALYGGSTRYLSRQALHGERLLFEHPLSGESLTVEAPLPNDLQRLLSGNRRL